MSPTRIIRGSLWLPGGVEDGVLEVDDSGCITDVRPARQGDPAAVDGLVLPGLVNAHTHLEFSNHRGLIPPAAEGFLPWLRTVMQLDRTALPDRVAEGQRGAAELMEAGTAWVWDVSNDGDTAPWMLNAGLRGMVQHEVLGFDRAQVTDTVARLSDFVQDGVIRRRPAPHALVSTAPELVRAAVEACPWPCTLHVGEAEDEAEFVAAGTGPIAALLDAIGRDWQWWQAGGHSPLELLDSLGVLGPQLLLVHGVRLSASDVALAVERKASVCLCPRSNQHIGGRIADVRSFVDAGLSMAVGTDSLASTPDLDLFGELVVLVRACPDVPATRWLAMATHEGADVVQAPVGRLEIGRHPGVLQVGLSDPGDLSAGTPDRQWLVRPHGSGRM